ncbi:hypothetical protein [Mammaliicoccus stepanovicii]|uniref:Integral membrane protein n=2 Tax=Mammaliicoccus stepanovicii TaxID=643214 RepID=A0A239YK75_9STAP|nr:hypothetical protein [Mammaliicoccus stepanovicii]PNZ76907.1 hypothetical protein CD111_05770 [Mammaliicoccus stepanovicii]GGI41005.1 hypothetical protein GCM10010896_11200 [Mammaliicoccus stepanovicii]SNV59140.1 Uncharacterised protein [Mammaliicoccus stepanovicii]
MKRGIKTVLLVLSIILLISELLLAIPFIGGSIVLSTGYNALVLNGTLYFISTIILLIDNQNTVKVIFIIPLIGLIASFVAIIPVIGWILHIVMVVLMIIFLFTIIIAPVYIPSKYYKTTYKNYK